MKKQLNISVFGLKLTTIDELKLIIEGVLPETYSINWSNISDAQLDVLLISHLFYDLPNIVAIRTSPHIKTLKIAHDPHLHGQVIEDTLYLPAQSTALQHWFEQYVLEDNNSSEPTLVALAQLQATQSSTISPAIEAPIQQQENEPTAVVESACPQVKAEQLVQHAAQHTSKIAQATLQRPLKNSQQPLLPSNSPTETVFLKPKSALAEQLFEQKIHYKYFEQLQQQLWQSDEYRQCIITATNDKIALLDKPNHQFWLSRSIGSIKYTSFELQHADLNHVVRFCHKNQAYDLHYGLWNFVWQNLEAQVPSYTGYYRLKYWPQPLTDRKDIFKIAGYLQHGADLDYIHKQTGIASEFIHRFVFTSLVSNMLEVIDEQQADSRFKAEQKHAVVEPPSAIRNFFGKLRKKLGL